MKERGKVPLMAVYRIRLLYAFLANQYLFEYVSCKIMVCNGCIFCVRIDRYTCIMKSTDTLDCSPDAHVHPLGAQPCKSETVASVVN